MRIWLSTDYYLVCSTPKVDLNYAVSCVSIWTFWWPQVSSPLFLYLSQCLCLFLFMGYLFRLPNRERNVWVYFNQSRSPPKRKRVTRLTCEGRATHKTPTKVFHKSRCVGSFFVRCRSCVPAELFQSCYIFEKYFPSGSFSPPPSAFSVFFSILLIKTLEKYDLFEQPQRHQPVLFVYCRRINFSFSHTTFQYSACKGWINNEQRHCP